MYKLMRLFNQNKAAILFIVGAIVFIVIIIKLLNGFYAEQEVKAKEERANRPILAENYITQSEQNKSYSIVSGEKKDSYETKSLTSVIDSFVGFCNKGEIEKAYSLLSEDCKKEIYPTLNSFKEYCKINFSNKKDYNIELQYAKANMYKVSLFDDVMATGVINTSSNVMENIFVVVKENGVYKLNISGYIGKENIKKKVSAHGINMTVNYKKVFLDYEIYNITVENQTQGSITLDGNSSRTMYLVDSNDVIYESYKYELSSDALIFDMGTVKTLNIKYGKKFRADEAKLKLVFSNILMNNDVKANIGIIL